MEEQAISILELNHSCDGEGSKAERLKMGDPIFVQVCIQSVKFILRAKWDDRLE